MPVAVAANRRLEPSSNSAENADVASAASAGSSEATSELAAASPAVVGTIASQSVRMPGVAGSASGAKPFSSRRIEPHRHARAVAVASHLILAQHPVNNRLVDRKSVVSGKSVSVRGDPGGRRSIKKKKKKK